MRGSDHLRSGPRPLRRRSRVGHDSPRSREPRTPRHVPARYPGDAIPAMQEEAAASLVTSLPGTRLGEPEKVAQAPLAPPAGKGEGDG
jgi:hypothetical protein